MRAFVEPVVRKGRNAKPYTKYRARWDDPVTGREVCKTFELKREANSYLDTVTADIMTGHYADPREGRMTVASYAALWVKAQPWAESTYLKNAGKLARHILPVFGDRPLASVTTTELQAFVTDLGRAMAASTARDTWFLVTALFRSALRDRKIAVDPCVDVLPPAKVRTEVMIPTPDQVAALVDASPGWFRAAPLLAAGAGLRQSEVTGLAMDSLVFPTGTPILGVQRGARPSLAVERTLACLPGMPMFLKAPKSKASIREIGTGGPLADILTEHVRSFPPAEATLPWGRSAGSPITVALLFTVDGQPINRSMFADTWSAVVKAAGLSDIRFHDLRHYAVSSQIRHGASIIEVQHFAGHADSKTTVDTYGHLWVDSRDRITAGIASALDFAGTGRRLRVVEG